MVWVYSVSAPMVALEGLLMVMITVSSASSAKSSYMVMEMVFSVSPGLNVRVPALSS